MVLPGRTDGKYRGSIMRQVVLLLLLLFSAPSFAKETVSHQDRAYGLGIPWTDDMEAGLARAADSGRAVLIYFQADWCSWCHVYERNTLSDAGVIKHIRQDFIPIRINADARPDLMEKYRGVGLPYTVVLSASGKPLARLPGILNPEDMQDSLRQLARRAASDRAEQSPAQAGETLAQVTGLDRAAYNAFVSRWLEYLEELYDPQTGLFSGVLESGTGLKRPVPLTWIWLLESGLWPQRTRRAAYASLQNLYDAANGGFFFFRDPHRSDEHLETAKLLDVNAWLIDWFTLAGRRYDDRVLQEAARHSSEYLQRVLWDRQQGGFFQAQIADAAYYRSGGASGDRPGREPAVDRIKRADSNARAAIALADTARLSNDGALLQKAIMTVEYILRRHLHNNRLYHALSDQGVGEAYNLPKDIFWLLAAIQAVSQADPRWRVPSASQSLYRLAGAWLGQAMQKTAGREHSAELLGLIAYVAIHTRHPLIPRQATRWSLSQIRLTADTRPDELVYALRAWRQYASSREAAVQPAGAY